MSPIISTVAAALCIAGTFFFVAGMTGLLRFPDVYSRLHALTKADNVGLGLIGMGVALLSDTWMVGLKVMLIWVLAILASATVGNVIAAAARRGKVPARVQQ